ncbi:IS200/IS605 family element transposase accessory protein TnpB [Methanococcoides sp. SA1]|nr:IS200/IS605 family element transposase accessory protein TnpB [Methanococcoides sp. SA1]
MKRGNKFRLYPNDDQKTIIENHVGACRFVYNYSLGIKSLMYDKFRINISNKQLDEHLKVLKHTCYPWLKEVNSQSTQQSNRNLMTGYKNFFEGTSDFPTFKSKRDSVQSFQVTQRYKINLTTSEVWLPNIGWMKFKMHRDRFDQDTMSKCIKTTISNNGVIIEKKLNANFLRTVTISRTSTGKYHISILTEDGIPEPGKVMFDDTDIVGIDLGIKEFAILSNSTKIENPKHLRTSMKRLKTLQRRVSRKPKGSNNRKKAVLKLAKLHEKVANQRNDFQHKITSQLISENQAIAIEDLNVKGMVKNHCLAQAISDVAWGNFVRKLEYKADWYGKTILKIGRFEPSSKLCSVCGHKKTDLKLSDRNWTCTSCLTEHDRDVNAAINIKNIAFNNINAVGTTA